MEEKQRSWDRHISRLREKGWAQSRQDTSPIEVAASRSIAVDDDDLSSDSSYDNSPPKPDALDFVFETIEEYCCGHQPTRMDDWDRDNAGRGHINESKSEVFTLYKLGEGQKRSSVADRIKAFEASSAAPSTPRINVDQTANRIQAVPRSTSPVSRWRKPADQQSPSSPGSWQRREMPPWKKQQMQRTPGSRSPASPSSWQRPQMASSPGTLPSWVPTDTPSSDVVRSSNKVPVSPRSATSAYGTKSEKKQSIPAWPEKLNGMPRKSTRQGSIFASIIKDSATEPSGLSFVSYYEKDGIYISKIRSSSKFKQTDLKRGMKVLRINGAHCPSRVKTVIKMLQTAGRVVEIEAIRDDSIEFVAKEKPSKKETSTKKSGSRAEPRRSRSPSKRERQHPEEKQETTEKAATNDVGFADSVMLSLGYVPNKPQEEPAIERKDSSASIASLDRSEIPEKPKNKKVHAMVFKTTRRDKIGISFVSFKKKRGVYIYEMYEDSKFQRTGLEVGMKVLSINRQPCPERVSETLAMVKDIQGQLIITAVAPSDDSEVAREGSSSGTKQQPVLTGSDGKPKVQTLNKLGKDRLRRYPTRPQSAYDEEPQVSEGEILNKRERREILGDHSWMDYDQDELASSYSQDSQTTSSTATEEQLEDDGSWWGSSLASVFGT